MPDEVYDEHRARRLEELLGSLARRILELEARRALLPHAVELLELLGDCRSELFHYEVRATYDTPEIAEHRRLVADAERESDAYWSPTDWNPDEGDTPTW